MLVDLQFEHVLVAALVVGPNVGLANAHPIEGTLGQSVKSVGQLLGVGKGTADTLDDAQAATGIDRHASVPGRVGVGDPHLIAGSKFRVGLAHSVLFSLSLISAARDSTSARVSRPFSCIRLMKP